MTRARWYDKWIVLLFAFCNYVVVNGVIYAFGVLYVELLDQFGEDKDVTAWIGSIQLGVVNLGGKWLYLINKGSYLSAHVLLNLLK